MSALGLRTFCGVSIGLLGSMIGIQGSLIASALAILAVALALPGLATQPANDAGTKSV